MSHVKCHSFTDEINFYLLLFSLIQITSKNAFPANIDFNNFFNKNLVNQIHRKKTTYFRDFVWFEVA